MITAALLVLACFMPDWERWWNCRWKWWWYKGQCSPR